MNYDAEIAQMRQQVDRQRALYAAQTANAKTALAAIQSAHEIALATEQTLFYVFALNGIYGTTERPLCP